MLKNSSGVVFQTKQYTFKNQFAFTEGTSTNETLQKLAEEITNHLDNGKESIVVFLD